MTLHASAASRPNRIVTALLAALLVAILLLQTAAAPLREPNADDDFTLREVMLPMRDGVKLYTIILTPKNAKGDLPILLQRTPYEASATMGAKAHPDLNAVLGPRFAELPGYIWVFQDIRGRYKSEGDYSHNRPLRGPLNDTPTDESTDAWDSIEWLVRNVQGNNGRVGIYGTSNPGWLVLNALIGPHPALKAAVPVNAVGDLWMGDDYFHNGAFRLSFAVEYLYRMGTRADAQLAMAFNHHDLYSWFLKAGSAGDIDARYFDKRQAFWKLALEHPAYDVYWQAKAMPPLLSAAKTNSVPTLNVHGWFDQEDIYGAPATYKVMEEKDAANDRNFFSAGPWYHGQSWGNGENIGAMRWSEDTAKRWREDVLAPFLAHYLKDGPAHGVAPATVFETGSNRWRRFDAWPPRQVEARKLYLGGGNSLVWAAPGGEGSDSYVSDPAKPVPYQPRPIRRIVGDADGLAGWRSWLTMDQRFVDGRPDVLTYVSPPLEEPLTLRGTILAHLQAATSGTDSDWVVKVIDVFPDDNPGDDRLGGYQFMVAGDILRGRYRESFSTPRPIAANRPLGYELRLPQVNHRFRRGHRLMVQIQSSWFPLYDRNPQRFVPSIMHAKPSDYRAATQTIYRSARFPSYLELPVDPSAD
ncbi:CocE/NonD family hydrolase [Sphingomonas colocasiae]|uniref:CocE/NonD family hydrolase n=1 Tax=Sphingomonas colocasiae TaxID=1848973 RepID=A0ABS7PNP0_9SPHN|nr:CocE/NonD family hydrolase [Sphingomonas colocasiae]MBY8822938.1 CocE/NonD family hydrolase [Sphingomonas colocasiae]